MMYAGWGLWLNQEISLEKLLQIYTLSQEAMKQKKFSHRLKFYTQMVKVICIGKIRWYHGFLVRRILIMADLIGKEKSQYDFKEHIVKFVNWLSPRTGLSPAQIMRECSQSQIVIFSKQAIEYGYRKDALLATAYHLPDKFFQNIRELYDFQKAVSVKIAQIEERVETLVDDMKVLSIAGGMYG